MATYYVATNGNDSNDGSVGSPWATTNHTLAAGDIVYIRGGNYNIRINPGQSGSSGNPITYAAFPNEIPLIQGVSATENIINITNVNWITVKGLHVTYNINHTQPAQQNGKWRWNWVNIGGSASNIVLEDLVVIKDTFDDPGGDYDANYLENGIKVGGGGQNIALYRCYVAGINKGIHIGNAATTRILIRDCCIEHTVQSCIVVQGSGLPSAFRGVQVEGTLMRGSFMEDGIQFQAAVGGNADNWGTIIRYCVFEGNLENAIDLKGARYICIEWNIIQGSMGSNNGGYTGTAISPPGNNRNSLQALTIGSGDTCSDIIIRNNVFYDNARGVHQRWNRMHIYNNTFLYNNRDFTGTDSSYNPTGNIPGFVAWRPSSNTQFDGGSAFNNIAGGHRAGAMALYFASGLTRYRLDRNIYFAGQGGDASLIEVFSSGNFLKRNLTDWKAYVATKAYVLGQDATSINVANLAALGLQQIIEKPTGSNVNYRFRPLSTSPAYKTGTYHAKTVGTGSNSSTMVVDDATIFRATFNCVYNMLGDQITLSGGRTARITSINYNTNTLTLSNGLTWSNNENVFFGPTITPHIGMDFGDFAKIVLPNTQMQFFANVSGCTPSAYNWEYSLNGGAWTQFSTNQNPEVAFTASGAYDIRVTITCGLQNITDTQNLVLMVL